MNSLSEFLHEIALAFEHFIGDPVHSQAATALKSTLQAAGTAVEAGAGEAIEKLHNAVAELTGQTRAATPEDWAELHKTATVVKAEASQVQAAAPAAPEAPPGASTPPAAAEPRPTPPESPVEAAPPPAPAPEPKTAS